MTSTRAPKKEPTRLQQAFNRALVGGEYVMLVASGVLCVLILFEINQRLGAMASEAIPVSNLRMLGFALKGM